MDKGRRDAMVEGLRVARVHRVAGSSFSDPSSLPSPLNRMCFGVESDLVEVQCLWWCEQ